MRNQKFLAGIAILILPLSAPASAQEKGQNGKGGEKSKSVGSNEPGRKDNKQDKKNGNKPADRGNGNAAQSSRSKGDADNYNKRDAFQDRGGAMRVDRKDERKGQKADLVERGGRKLSPGGNARARMLENGRYAWREPAFQGCPPGLAKKNNGCIPPGQARKLADVSQQETRWLRYSNWFDNNRGDDWRYDQGYAYRINPSTNLIQSILPLLGGALAGGNAWPQSSIDYQVSPYYSRLYGSGPNDSIRYADGAMFSVNPETQMIGSIVGLLSGDGWNVGAPAPQGYDLYNVPYDYRDEYADSATSSYRYNDGYMYEVDPTTQIVRTIIELVL
jgi:hypothetical protein